MNFCLSYNQSPAYLQQAEEIKIPWTQRNKIEHYVNLYPNAVIIIQHLFSGKPIDWNECEQIFDDIDGALVLCLGNPRDCIEAYERDIPFYYGFPITTYDELNSIIQFDPYYIIPGPPLFFNLSYLKETLGLSLRIFPNINNLTGFPKVKEATGTWVRPEDLDYYSKFIDSCEFPNVDYEAERALFRIYKQEKKFYGPISLIIHGLEEYNADNDLISSEYSIIRTYCQQKCESHERRCTICEMILHLADPDALQHLKDKYVNDKA